MGWNKALKVNGYFVQPAGSDWSLLWNFGHLE